MRRSGDRRAAAPGPFHRAARAWRAGHERATRRTTRAPPHSVPYGSSYRPTSLRTGRRYEYPPIEARGFVGLVRREREVSRLLVDVTVGAAAESLLSPILGRVA